MSLDKGGMILVQGPFSSHYFLGGDLIVAGLAWIGLGTGPSRHKAQS